MSDVLRRAINHLTLTQEFFASLLFEMKLVALDEPPNIIGKKQDDANFKWTLATDYEHIFYNPKFVNSLTVPVAAFALAHEVGHPMLNHLQRIYEHHLHSLLVDQYGDPINPKWALKLDSKGRAIRRDPTLWNMAGDYVINLMLMDSGFHLWPECLVDEKYRGWTTEQVYDDLLQDALSKGAKLEEQEGGGVSIVGYGSPDGICGHDLAEPDMNTDIPAQVEEWKDRVVRAAAVAKSRGHLPASIEDLVREFTEPQYPVWLLMERFVDATMRDEDYSWARPHSHFLPLGLVLPGAYSERVSHIIVIYDTSGSVSNEDLSRFHRIGGDIVRNAMPLKLTLIECDAAVHKVHEIHAGDEWPSEIKLSGRGGTSFKPPFTWIQKHQANPTVVIYLTDLMGDFPDPPPYPVLWVNTEETEAPFGQTIHMGAER